MTTAASSTARADVASDFQVRTDSERLLLGRLTALAGLSIVELLTLSVWLDTGTLSGGDTVTALVADYGPSVLRLVTASALCVLVFGGSRPSANLRRAAAILRNHNVAWTRLVGHAALIAVFAKFATIMFAGRLPAPLGSALMAVWIITGAAAAILAATAILPVRVWAALARAGRSVLGFALAVGIGAYAFGLLALRMWRPLSRSTMGAAHTLLDPFVAGIQSDPSTLIIGGPTFRIQVSPECSGYEGLGLMLVFISAWLWFHRDEWRFPRALLLIPAGLTAIWVTNCIRIAGLVAIGNAGGRTVALGGFHSEAGWLAFNAVALGICLGARRMLWLTRRPTQTVPVAVGSSNPAAAFLVPFLAIVATGMVSRLVADGFESLYPLRVIACAAALWFFRGAYVSLNWRIGWAAPTLGCLVFAVWIVLEPVAGSPSPAVTPAALIAAPAWSRDVWLLFRVFGAVVTVPLAEELAFRGFLLRRFVAADFELVSWQSVSWFAILMSSLAFGVLHGDRWLAGTIAGGVYAFALLRRASIGDAVAAHAITNALLAGWVLRGGEWQFW